MARLEDAYELIDFGNGRKLERFGETILDRPCPATERAQKAQPQQWQNATARYERTSGAGGRWIKKGTLPKKWQLALSISLGDQTRPLVFELQPSPFGHIGIFAEQVANWQWIAGRLRQHSHGLRVLNLFAYTGGSTLAAAAAGAEVVHLDAAQNVVRRARRNAELSNLSRAPIRWITEDAVAFCRREVRRGNRYHAIILDPPSYGHGPKGEPWKITQHLAELLALCGELTDGQPQLLLATCHSSGIGPAELSAYLSDGIFGSCARPPATGSLELTSASGRRLPSGVFARWPG